MRSDLGGLGLRPFFDRRRERGFLVDAAPGTIKLYHSMLRRWSALTDDPPTETVGKDVVDGFRAALQRGEGKRRRGGAEEGRRQGQLWLFDPPPIDAVLDKTVLAPATINRHLRHLHHVLVEACDLEILERVPKFSYLKVPRRRPRIIQEEHLQAIYRACWVAGFPVIPGVRADYWWKALLTTACTLAFRRQGLLGLRWEDVDLRGGLIGLQAEDDKCDQERVKPLSRLVIQHLVRIRTDRELVFAWPHSERTFYRQWHRIQDAADVPDGQHYKVHDLKRTCGTLHAQQHASPWAVKELLDHATLRTSEYYIDASQEAREAVERLQLPPAFSADFKPDPGAAAG